MKNVKVLDCTLRDGGRIIDCAFPNEEIRDMSQRLSGAKIDIVEIGFLRDHRDVEYKGNSTFFTDVDQIRPFIDKSNTNTMYVAFIDYGMFDFSTLKPYDGTSIDGIRYGFTKKDFLEHREEITSNLLKIKECNYKLFIQGVNSLNYSDKEILELIDLVNDVCPYSFGIVDTYGAMYIDDVDRLYGLIDRNMHSDICINFHSHNNYQLSFGFAQEVIRLSRGTARNVIIDATLGGIGKVAGNLNTELLVDYLVRKLRYDYQFEDILDLIDDYVHKYSLQHKWGYSVPAMMAGVYKSHPNNIIYLTEKFKLQTKDISNILAMIEPAQRQRYNYDNIQRLYIQYTSKKIDDHETIAKLKKKFSEKDILVLVPGQTLQTHKAVIDEYISENNPMVISVNFNSGYPDAITFFGNQKRYQKYYVSNRKTIVSSNISPKDDSPVVVNYYSLINRKYKYFENSTMMLLNLLKRLDVKHIVFAGFDGFDMNKQDNYFDTSFQNDRHMGEFNSLNAEIALMLQEYMETVERSCVVQSITPSLFF